MWPTCGQVTIWKIYIATITRLSVNEPGRVLTSGIRFSTQICKSCYIFSHAYDIRKKQEKSHFNNCEWSANTSEMDALQKRFSRVYSFQMSAIKYTTVQIWKSATVFAFIWKYVYDFTLKQVLLFEIRARKICEKFVYKFVWKQYNMLKISLFLKKFYKL